MRVLIFGHRGWIGQKFVELLEKESDCEIFKAESSPGKDHDSTVEKEIRTVAPTHVCLFIGRTHGPGCSTIDYIEDKLDLNVRDNLYAPILMALICKELKIHLSYIGTGCIFHYDNDHPQGGKLFTEDDLPNFFGSSYSVVKGFTDRLMHNFEEDVLNLRIRMPISYDHNERNFITKITSYKKVVDVPNSMTVLPQLLPKIIVLMRRKAAGTYNLVHPGSISHNEILTMYKEIVDPEFTWENFSIEEQNQILKSKRSNCELDTSKLTKLFPDVLGVRDAIRVSLEQIKLSSPSS